MSVQIYGQEKKNSFPIFHLCAKKPETQSNNKIQFCSFENSYRKETFDACSVIHGGSSLRPDPVIEGMVDKLNSKLRTKQVSNIILNSKSKLLNSVKNEVGMDWLKSFKKSEENKLRSLNTYYSQMFWGNETIKI